MIIKRNNYLEIIPENSFEYSVVKQIITRECVRDNPLYIKAKKTNRFQKDLSRYIKTYKEAKDKFYIYKANQRVLDMLLDANLPYRFEDGRVSNKIDIELKKGPRDKEQKIAIDKLMYHFTEGFGYGCLNAAPAAGKTYMAVNLITKLREKTLIVIDMGLLLDQFIKSLTFFTDLTVDDIGIVSDGKVDVEGKKIIIATVQTLIKKEGLMDQLSKEIGFLIVDEVHVASSNTFQLVIPKFRPMYQLGLSGSHERDDKMEFLTQESVGPIAAEIEREALIEAGSIMTPILRPIFLKDDDKFDKYNRDGVDFRSVVNNYYNCPKTIEKISKFVNYHYNNGRSQLLICKEKNVINAYYNKLLEIILGEDFIKECKKEIDSDIEKIKLEMLSIENEPLENFSTKKDLNLLENKKMSRSEFKKKYQVKKDKKINELSKKLDIILKKDWKSSKLAKENEKFNSVVIITGDANSVERERIIDEANSGKIKILITSVVLDKAVSINRLDTLHLLFSTRERANTIQRVGRISRTFTGKTDAVVYDYIYDHYMSFYQFDNAAGECRMHVHRKFTQVNQTNDLFIKFLKSRFRDNFYLTKKEQDDFEQIKKRYIMEIS